MQKRQKIGLGLASLILFFALVLPVPDGLSLAGWRTIGVTLFFLILLVSEALPLAVSSLLTVGLIPLLGVTERFEGAVIGFAHPVIFFILASFGIAGAIASVPMTKRMLLALLKRTGNRVSRVLLVMMVATAGVSFFMSNVPACAIMIVVALEFVDLLEEGAAKKSIGRTFMIAIPVATMIGGMATPASSSLNLLAISLLEQYTGLTISFVQWMAIGIPLVLILIPLAWFLMLKVYKPAEMDAAKIAQYKDHMRAQIKGPMERKEISVLVILAGMLALWIASTWVAGIEIFTVAVLGCVLFFLPGVRVLTWGKFLAGMNWDIIFISGTVLSIAAALVANGVNVWLVDVLYPAQWSMGTHLLVGFAALAAFVMLMMITSAPALITMLAGPFVTIALLNGVSPALLIMALAFCAGNCYLFPLDTVQLLSYSKGYYRMTDMGRSTVFLQGAMVLILALWLPLMGRVVGLT